MIDGDTKIGETNDGRNGGGGRRDYWKPILRLLLITYEPTDNRTRIYSMKMCKSGVNKPNTLCKKLNSALGGVQFPRFRI
jgi:hypothetical protein